MLEIEKQKLHVPLRPSKTPTINQTTPMWAARSIDKMVHHSHSTHWPMFRPAFFDDPNEWRMAEVSRARSINSKRLAGIEKLPPLTFIFFCWLFSYFWLLVWWMEKKNISIANTWIAWPTRILRQNAIFECWQKANIIRYMYACTDGYAMPASNAFYITGHCRLASSCHSTNRINHIIR